MVGLLEHPDERVQVLAAARLAHKSTLEETRAQRFLAIAKLPWGRCAIEPKFLLPEHLAVFQQFLDKQPLLPAALRYGGAHTHRFSGEYGLNLQNLPRDSAKSKLRHALLAPPEHQIITADLAQIEARIAAWFCGQNDLVAQFANGDDAYSKLASEIFGFAINKKQHPVHRHIGKAGILGAGYGCGANRFYQMVVSQSRQFGIELGDLFSPEIAQKTINTYRDKFPYIPAMWKRLDQALYGILLDGNREQYNVIRPVTLRSGRIELPNGLCLLYDLKRTDHHLYGAKILENITQALARIVLMQAALRLATRGYKFCLQVHDELVFIVPNDAILNAKQTIYTELTRVPDWAPGLPLAVDIGAGANYGTAK